MTDAPTSTVARRLDALPFTRTHLRVLTGSGTGWALDAMDVGLISFIIAALIGEWSLSTSDASWIASVGFMGMAIGATVGGLLADRLRGDVGQHRHQLAEALGTHHLVQPLVVFVVVQPALRIGVGEHAGRLGAVGVGGTELLVLGVARVGREPRPALPTTRFGHREVLPLRS